MDKNIETMFHFIRLFKLDNPRTRNDPFDWAFLSRSNFLATYDVGDLQVAFIGLSLGRALLPHAEAGGDLLL